MVAFVSASNVQKYWPKHCAVILLFWSSLAGMLSGNLSHNHLLHVTSYAGA